MENIETPIQEYYRNIFSTHEGAMVLAHILFDLGLFQETGNLELKNYAARLLNIIGYHRVDVSSLETFIKAIIKQGDNKNE